MVGNRDLLLLLPPLVVGGLSPGSPCRRPRRTTRLVLSIPSAREGTRSSKSRSGGLSYGRTPYGGRSTGTYGSWLTSVERDNDALEGVVYVISMVLSLDLSSGFGVDKCTYEWRFEVDLPVGNCPTDVILLYNDDIFVMDFFYDGYVATSSTSR